MSNTPSNAIPYVPQNTQDPAAGLNLALNVIDALLNTRVINMTTTAPPGSPADGDMYVVGAGATGAWATHDHAFARWVADGAFWQFYAAGVEAWLVLNKADGNLYKWNAGTSAWEQAAGIGEAPLDGSFYGRKSGAWAAMPDVTHVVTSVNGHTPDTSGEVTIPITGGIDKVNGQEPDSHGDVEVSAAQVPFDPDTSSGLTSTNVEAALNELGSRPSGGGSSHSQSTLSAAILANSPVGYWKCSETSGTTLTDSGSSGKNMTLRGTNTIGYSQLVAGGSGLLTALSATGANGALVAGTPMSAPYSRDWTCCAVVNSGDQSGQINWFAIGANGETEVVNFQLELANLAGGSLQMLWEFGAGSNQVIAGPKLPINTVLMIHGRKNTTAKTFTWFINGRRIIDVAYTNEPTGGTDATVSTGINCDAGSTSTALIAGLASNVALFNAALTDSQIMAHAQAGGFA
jgi:Protein of unknown function (DUF2793)